MSVSSLLCFPVDIEEVQGTVPDSLLGLRKSADFFDNHRNSAGSAGSGFKNRRFFEIQIKKFQKIKKSRKIM
jgi:hypothetical protein